MTTRGLSYSLFFHSIVLIIVAFGFPAIFQHSRDIPPSALTVEIVSIKDITNLPKSQKPIKKDPPKEAKPAPRPQQKTRQDQPRPEPKKPDPVLFPKPDITPKKETPKPKEPDKPKEKPDEKPDEFALLLDKLKKEDAEKPDEKPAKNPQPESATSKSDSEFLDSIPLSISEKDAIRSQFATCWRMPAGASGDYNLSVEVEMEVNQDGSVKNYALVKNQVGRYQSDPVFRAAADSAIRAVKLCSPLKNLPPDKYHSWKSLVVNFDPREMLF